MLLSRRRTARTSARTGFSLVELSIVLAIMSIVAVFGLEAAATFVTRTAGNISKERLVTVDVAIANFFRIYGRLPCPADRGLSPTPPSNYGLEDCTIAVLTSTTVGGGVMSGAVPFRTLNLPSSASIDGFENKINYVVTKNLTVAGTTSGRFGNATDGVGGIEVRSGILEQPCSSSKCQILANPAASPNQGAAYFLFSSGADRRGARTARGSAAVACVPAAASHGRRIDSQNCVQGDTAVRALMTPSTIPYNVFYDSRFNAGLNLVNYFDDYVLWRSKAML
jgi:prepilin-type N-terminal cleavage/methylation domain-containing protein